MQASYACDYACLRVGKMANFQKSVVVGGAGGVLGAGIPGARMEVPMEVEVDKGVVTTLGKAGPLG